MTPEPPRLQLDATLFTELISELARRGNGTRESAAFLLTKATSDSGERDHWQTVTAVAYYDDLDRASLTGNITFSANGYTALAALCRQENLQIAADIHTHPDSWVRQSRIDADHPMVALPGHLALIAPNFARPPIHVTDLGAYLYQGSGQWTSRYGNDVARILQVIEPIHAPRPLLRAATWIRRLLPALTRRGHRT